MFETVKTFTYPAPFGQRAKTFQGRTVVNGGDWDGEPESRPGFEKGRSAP